MPDTMDYNAWQRVKQWVLQNASPTGIISAFAGISADVPEGWLLCDGREVSRTEYARLFNVIGVTYGEGNGSTTFNIPDLRGCFPLGLSTSYMLGQTGGETSHILTTNEMPSHTHTQNSHNHSVTVNSGGSHTHTATTSSNGLHSHSGTTASAGAHTHPQNAATSEGGDLDVNYDIDGYVYSSGRSVAQGINTASAGAHTHSFSTNSTGAHTHTLTTSSNGSHNHSGSIGSTTATNQNTGGGQAHNNMPPYLVVNYIIKY